MINQDWNLHLFIVSFQTIPVLRNCFRLVSLTLLFSSIYGFQLVCSFFFLTKYIFFNSHQINCWHLQLLAAKLDFVRTRWGLAFAAVTNFVASFVMAIGICAFFDVLPSSLNVGYELYAFYFLDIIEIWENIYTIRWLIV